MMTQSDLKEALINEVVEISKLAGKSILEIYKKKDFELEFKDDQSPLTEADIASHKIIVKSLKEITPHIPVLSEEDSDIPFNIRSKWETYWLIDPLDGTKEFIKRNGEFTVNIALINNHEPIFGVIHVPEKNQTYWGSVIRGSFFQESSDQPRKITVSQYSKNKIRIVSSRTHRSKKLGLLLEKIDNYEILSVGSSLKFCLIAKGVADLYPRIGPTSEWDIAAGHAIMRFAGGHMQNIEGKKIKYNLNRNLINPYFIASNNNVLGNKMRLLLNDYIDSPPFE